MKVLVAVVVCTAFGTPTATGQEARQLKQKDAEQKRQAFDYVHANSVIRPIQQELKEQFDESMGAEEGIPTFAPTLEPSASPGPSDLPSMLPSMVPSDVPSGDILLEAGFGSDFPSLTPSESLGPSDFPTLVPSAIDSEGPSLLPSNVALAASDVPTVIDETFTTIGDTPTLGPSESPRPSSGSDTPSLTPSLLPSQESFDDAELLNMAHIEEGDPEDDPLIRPTEMPSKETMSFSEELLPRDDPLGGGGNATPITCDLDATIECETIDDQPCEFERIAQEDVMCQGSASHLAWLYKGGKCGNSTGFMCEDLVEGGPSTVASVFIEIHGEEANEIYYQGTATKSLVGKLDSVIELNRTFSVPVENLFVHIKKNNEYGETLQILALPHVCHHNEGMIIGNTYGSLQFVGYATEDKYVRGYRELKWTFAATSGDELTVKTATAVLGARGNMKTFISGETLLPGEESTFTCFQTVTITGEEDTFQGGVNVVGEALDGSECAATSVSFLRT